VARRYTQNPHHRINGMAIFDKLPETRGPTRRSCHCVSGRGDQNLSANSSHSRTYPAPFVAPCCIDLRNGRGVRLWHRLPRIEPQICTTRLGLPLLRTQLGNHDPICAVHEGRKPGTIAASRSHAVEFLATFPDHFALGTTVASEQRT